MHSYLTVKEVAAILKLNPITVYEYIRAGSLPAFRFGRYYRVDAHDFERFIRLKRVGKADT